jgi:hypothetical protein
MRQSRFCFERKAQALIANGCHERILGRAIAQKPRKLKMEFLCGALDDADDAVTANASDCLLCRDLQG